MTINTAEELLAKVASLKARIAFSHERITKATGDSFTPPEGVRSAAARGLELRAKWKRGGITNAEASSQGIGSGVQRATNLKNGDAISLMTIKRMRAFFSRHQKNNAPDKKMPDGGPTAGTIAWLLWGGNAGRDWADSVLSRVEKMNGGDSSAPAASGPTPSAVHVPAPMGKQPEKKKRKTDTSMLTPTVVERLVEKAAAHNERSRHDWQSADVEAVKEVYARGLSAYAKDATVSKGVWAMSRVNDHLKLLRNGKPESPAYVMDDDLLPSGHPRAK